MIQFLHDFLTRNWSEVLWGALRLSLVSFGLMGADKRRAKRGQWRISERALLLTALLGGSPGAILGMHLFHHKTKHWYFRYGLPVILLLQAAGVLWLLFCPAVY